MMLPPKPRKKKAGDTIDEELASQGTQQSLEDEEDLEVAPSYATTCDGENARGLPSWKKYFDKQIKLEITSSESYTDVCVGDGTAMIGRKSYITFFDVLFINFFHYFAY